MKYDNWEDLEFVVIDENGKEVDTYDPVVSATEDDSKWIVDNLFNIYEIKKKSGYTYVVRNMDKGE